MRGQLVSVRSFNRHSFHSATGIFADFYFKSISAIVEDHSKHCSNNTVMSKPLVSRVRSHLLNFDVGGLGCSVAEHFIKTHPHQKLSTKSVEAGGDQTIIAAVQLFSDKSKNSLKAGDPTFYTPYIIVLNFMEEMRIVQITKGRKLLAYSPVFLNWTEKMMKLGHSTIRQR